jgi:hypothetical protein
MIKVYDSWYDVPYTFSKPKVICVNMGKPKFVVVGTLYGHIHTTGGDIRTWKSYSGARKALLRYDSGVM